MGTTLQGDVSVGIKVETTYDTPVTVAAHFEPDSVSVQMNQNFLQGSGLRAGKVVDRSDRRVLGKKEAAGDLVFDLLSIDTDILTQAWLGNLATSGAGPYYHLAKCATSDVPPSYTIQIGYPLRDGGAAQPHTYSGMCVSSGTLSVSNDGIFQLSTTWTGASLATATAFVTPAYTAAQTLFGFHQTTSLAVGGAVTAPTTSAVGTGGTAVTNVRDFSVSVDNALDANGWNLGGGGVRSRPPAYGLRKISGTMTVEFDSVTQRDAYLAGTAQQLLLTVTSSDGSVLQVYLGAVTYEPGSMVTSQAGDVLTASMAFTAKDDGTHTPLLVLLKNANAT